MSFNQVNSTTQPHQAVAHSGAVAQAFIVNTCDAVHLANLVGNQLAPPYIVSH